MTPGMTPYAVASGATWQCPPWAVVPSGAIDTRSCRSCGARVAWLKTIKTGSLAPVNADGVSHFATCPQAPSWRKPKAGREEAAL
jgi:hypothetical protein